MVEVSAAQELCAVCCVLGGLGCPGQELQRGAVRCCAVRCCAVRCCAVRCLGCVRRERFAIVGKLHSECEEILGGNKAPGQEASERVFARQLTRSRAVG